MWLCLNRLSTSVGRCTAIPHMFIIFGKVLILFTKSLNFSCLQLWKVVMLKMYIETLKRSFFKLCYVTQVHSCHDVNNIDVVQPTISINHFTTVHFESIINL